MTEREEERDGLSIRLRAAVLRAAAAARGAATAAGKAAAAVWGRLPAAAAARRGAAAANAAARRLASWAAHSLWARLDRGPPLASAAALALAFLAAIPSPSFPGGLSVAVYARRGELLGAAVSESGQWRLPSGKTVPPRFVQALSTYEDKRFFSHAGVDPIALARAVLQNARAGKIVSGGSTISMQVARLGRPGSERAIGEKALEALMAIRLELFQGKSGVLRLYAENAPFGGNVVGIEAASFRFFGRPPASLSWAEAATLAVLPNAPSAAHPGKNRELLQSKRDRLLRAMAQAGKMGEGDLALALAEPLPPSPFDLPRLAPQLVDRFVASAAGGNAAGRVGLGAARVETTIDASLQERATDILARRVARLEEGGVFNGACIVARVDTGEVLAYVANVPADVASAVGARAGTRSGSHGEAVDLVRAERSSGSLFKPFLYAAALDAGELGPRSLLPDVPTRYGSYEPENNLGNYSGAVRADEALARSLNVPFVRLLKSFGVERFRDLLVSTGMTTLRRRAEDYGLTLILGGAETDLWEIAGRFAALARTAASAGRAGSRASGESQVFDLGLTREELAARPRRPESLFGRALPSSPWTRSRKSRAPRRKRRGRTTPRRAASPGRPARASATGTRGRSASTAPSSSASGWETRAGRAGHRLKGLPRPRPYSSTCSATWTPGLSGRTRLGRPLWRPTREIRTPTRPARPSARSRSAPIPGWAAGPDCPRVEMALVPAAAKSLPVCPYCTRVALSADGRYRVRAEEEDPANVRIEKLFVLPPAMERYFSRNLDYKSLPPWKPGSAQSGSDNSLAIIAPEDGASLFIPVEITGRPGATVFTAAHRDRGAVVFWQLDGEYLGSTRGVHALEARPGPGPHTLTVVDGLGRSVSRHFTVLSGN